MTLSLIRLSLALLFLPQISFAAAAVTYHGRLLQSDGTPVTSASVQFKIQIRTPGSGNCLLYEETHTKDLSQSNGMFAIGLNDGTAWPLNAEPFGLDRVFQNRGVFNFGPGKCVLGSSYTPNLADGRNILVEFNDGSFVGWEPLPPLTISFVPMAIESVTVGGFNASSLLRVVDGSGDPAAATALSLAQHSTLLDLVNGTSAIYRQSAVSISGADVSGNIVGNSAGFTGNLAGDVTGSQGATSVVRIQGRSVDTAAPSNGQVLKWVTGNNRWEPANDATGGGGGVTSVGVVVPGYMTSSGGPITSSGDLTLGFGSQAGGLVFASPLSGSGAPAFRALQIGDIQSANTGDFLTASGACATGEHLTYMSGTDTISCQPYSLSSAQVTGALTYTPVNPTALANYLALAGGTMTGHLNMGGQRITNIGNVPFVATNPSAGQDGQTLRWNNTSGQWEWFTAGAVGAGIGTLNGLSGATQNFAVSLTGTTPGMTSATTTHTLNLPLANATSVVAGLISKTEYDSFAAKVDSARTLTAGTGLTGGGTLAADRTFAVDVGTGANQIPQLDAGGKLNTAVLPTSMMTSSTTLGADLSGNLPNPTVARLRGVNVSTNTPLADQVLVYKTGTTSWEPTHFGIANLRTSLGGQQFSAASCTDSQTLTWSAITDAFACSNIVIASSNITNGTIVAADLNTAVTDGFWSVTGGSVYRSSGSVGIGTTSPNAGLQINGSLSHSGDISPPQITGNQNNYSPTGLVDAAVLRLNSDAARSLTGLAGGVDGRVIEIVNTGSFAITLANESGSSTAANRFAVGSNLVIGAGQGARLIYDNSSSRWRAIGNTTSGGATQWADVSPGIKYSNSVAIGQDDPTDQNILTIYKDIDLPMASSLYSNVQMIGSGGGVIAAGGIVSAQNSRTGTTTSGYGIQTGYTATNGSTTTNAYGVQALLGGSNAALTNAYGVKVNISTSGTGTVGSGYGVYIDDVTATTPYGVYQAGADDRNYFAGNVGVGTAIPGAALDVVGDTRVTGAFQATAEKVQTSVNSGASMTLPSQANGSIYRITLNANATLTLPADPGMANGMAQLVIVLKQDATGSRTLTWAAPAGDTILWSGGTTPTVCATAAQTTMYQFMKINGDTTWYAAQVWKQCP